MRLPRQSASVKRGFVAYQYSDIVPSAQKNGVTPSSCSGGSDVGVTPGTGTTCSILCAAPPTGCHYEGAMQSGPCDKVTCGDLVCECRSGDVRTVACTIDGVSGIRSDNCVDGYWRNGTCTRKVCNEGQERWSQCNLNGTVGWQQYICTSNAWKMKGGCIANIP